MHIEIPLDVITAPGTEIDVSASRSSTRPGPDPEAIAQAAELLRAARSPIVVLGGGSIDAPEQARALVDRLGAPTLLTINAKGMLPRGHALSLGSSMPMKPTLDALQSADVVLAIGTELGETDTLLFYDQLKITGKVIRIDIEAEQLTRNVLPGIGLCCDARLAMIALFDALGDFKPDIEAARTRVSDLRRSSFELVSEDYHRHGQFLDAVNEALPGVIVVGDSTQPVYGGNLTYEPDMPRSYFNSSTGYGTLGYGLPAAFGAKLACPDRPVVSLIGDGGIQFTIGDLATGVELGLPVPVLIWNNQGYGEIKQYMVDRAIPRIGVDIYTPDFQLLAKGFGCNAVIAENFDQLREYLGEADSADRPTIIEIDESSFSG